MQPFEFTAGSPVTGAAVKKISDSANGLFSGSGGPKPPPALSTAVLGMRSGGKVNDARAWHDSSAWRECHQQVASFS